ncbi:MAG: DUF1826 domain-containing protein [Pseudomonadota bacterium]
MKLLRKTIHDAAIGVAVADDPSSLATFLRPGCAAAIWRRQIPPETQAWLNGLDLENLPCGRIVLRPTAVADAVGHLCDIAAMPVGAERDWLEADVVALSNRFADLMGAAYLRMRLSVVTTNACRKFHIDGVSARLVCTYRGAGTQYGISTNNADPTRVFTVQTGAPILLKGTLWPGQPTSGLLHRSPPIEGTGESRLVLVVDPVFDPEDAF